MKCRPPFAACVIGSIIHAMPQEQAAIPPDLGDPSSVYIAMGMVTAPMAQDRRVQVRTTMLRYDAVTSGRMAFRFIIGTRMYDRSNSGAVNVRKWMEAIDVENRAHGDVLRLDALDGPSIEVACSCAEKLTAWMRYALHQWPGARYVGKTEDDTYVQLGVLEAELRALAEWRNLLFGYMTLAVLPSRPTMYSEQYPKRACVTNIQECNKDARAQKRPYTQGCFLGDLESKLHVPGKLSFDADKPAAVLARRAKARSKESPLIAWWRGAAHSCGMLHTKASSSPRRAQSLDAPQQAVNHHGLPEATSSGASDPASGESGEFQASTMAPFPTGPLAVFGRDLAEAVFRDCDYFHKYDKEARLWGRKTLCRGRHAPLSYSSTLCDTIVSHWIAKCNVEVTIAHTTRTKSHHYMWRGAGLGWMAPSNISLSVHAIKAKPSMPSGPNNTIGGEWAHVHETVAATTRVAFPPLLYRMRPHFALNSSSTQQLMRSLNPDVFHWYAQSCSFEHAALRRAGVVRAMAATLKVRGPRPAGMNDAKYLGGHPPGWPYSGCNPSRFRPYPRWPPAPGVLDAIRSAEVHEPTSERFVYHGYGPSAHELRPLVMNALNMLREAGGVFRVPATKFAVMLRTAVLPYRIAADGGLAVHYHLRKDAQKHWNSEWPWRDAPTASKLLKRQLELTLSFVHAKTSLEAFVADLTSGVDDLRGTLATRDQTYYWNWA